MFKRVIQAGENILWAGLILFLPITSLPLLSRAAGGSMVAPASVLPLILILILYTLPNIIRQGTLPKPVLPLMGLTLSGVLSTALAFFQFTPLFREINRLSNAISGLVTLAIGIGFYLAAAVWLDDTGRLNKIYRWINISGTVIVVWSLAQAAAWQLNQAYPGWMEQTQNILSVSGNLYDRRVTGLAFEPSWLGHQMVLLYLPYWLAATVQRTSAHPCKIIGIRVETVLLAGGMGVLGLALARSALVSFLLMSALLVLKGTGWVVRKLQLRASQRKFAKSALAPRIISVLIWAGVILLYIILIAAGVFALTRLDSRMENLFTLLGERLNFTELAYKLIFGERVVAWETGLTIFGQHPLFGVGINNAGFYFPQAMSPFGWTVFESHKLYYSNALPNTLSLWVRLLAETGMLGFSLFISWLAIIWKAARGVQNHPDRQMQTLALAVQLCLAALLMEGLSVDTFAFPYFWLMFGWITAAATRFSQKSVVPTVQGIASSEASGNGQTSSAG